MNNNISFENLTGQSGSVPPAMPNNNTYNILSLIFGIFSLVGCCISPYIMLVSGILAIVFCVISKKKGAKNGMAVAGLVCGIIGLVLGVVAIISLYVIGYVILNNPEFSSLFESISNMQV